MGKPRSILNIRNSHLRLLKGLSAQHLKQFGSLPHRLISKLDAVLLRLGTLMADESTCRDLRCWRINHEHHHMALPIVEAALNACPLTSGAAWPSFQDPTKSYRVQSRSFTV